MSHAPTRLRRHVFCLVASIVWLTSVGESAAVPINNSSFEIPVTGFFVDFIEGWTLSATSGMGVFRPSGAPGSLNGPVPDGDQVAFINGIGTISQVLSAQLTADTKYTLTVHVGDLANFDFSPYNIQLLAGTTVLASASGPAPSNGFFTTNSTPIFTASPGDPLLGQFLEIRLSGNGTTQSDVLFDKVTLLAEPLSGPGPGPAPVPEPATLLLLGSGLAGLVASRRWR